MRGTHAHSRKAKSVLVLNLDNAKDIGSLGIRDAVTEVSRYKSERYLVSEKCYCNMNGR